MDEFDKNIANLDVIDDYVSEKKQISKNNPDLAEHYTFGDHIARLICGSVFPHMDKLDEKPK